MPEKRYEVTLAGVRASGQEARLGRYELIYRIGSGGMADIFVAREKGAGGLERWVAIKRMHSHLASQSLFVQMLLDEARLAARIAHPNVAQVLEIGEIDGSPFLVMEYLHGEPLSLVIRRAIRTDGFPPIDLMARVVASACEGAHAAHELRGPDGENLNLVHRDLSPQNIFVTYDGAVKVVDFGVAKARGRSTTTEPGTLKGKFSYMSPEQARGRELDRRSDVFALGAVLYKATTGYRPFGDDADLVVLARVQNAKFVALSTMRPDFPVELESIVNRALAPTGELRFQTARELGEALDRFLVDRRVVTGPAQIAAMMRRLFAGRIRERESLLARKGVVAPDLPLDGSLEDTGDTPVPISDGGSRAKSGITARVGLDLVIEEVPTEAPDAMTSSALQSDSFGGIANQLEPAENSAMAEAAPSRRSKLILGGLAVGILLGLAGTRSMVRPPERAAPREEPAPAAHLPAAPVPDQVPPSLPAPFVPLPIPAVNAGAPPAAPAVDPPVLPAEPGTEPASRDEPGEVVAADRGGDPEVVHRPIKRIATDSGFAFVNIQSQPWSNVFLDGRPVRPTPIVGLRAPTGWHTVRLVTPDGRAQTRRIHVTSGRTAVVDVRF